MSRLPAEIDSMLRSMFPNNTRVRVKDVRDGSWAWPGVGIIVAFEPERPYFEGLPATKTQPERGPAFCVILDGPRKFDIWVRPDEIELVTDEEVAA